MKIAIVAVCYNAYLDSIKLIKSISDASIKVSDLDLHVVLCDNSSTNVKKNELDELKKNIDLAGFNYIKFDNIGYFPAFFEGKKILDRLSSSSNWDYVIITNVDLQLDVMFFNELSKSKFASDVGVIAPSIISKLTKEDINPKIFLRPSKKKLVTLYYGFQILWFYRIYTQLSLLKAKFKGFKRESRSNQYYKSGTEMYAAHGSIMLFTNSYFKSGASINYSRFLFGEEVFVAEEASSKGLKTVYCSELKVYDNEHGSTSREADIFISKEHVKSYKYLIKNYF